MSKIKEGDDVRVHWPTGWGGPYTVEDIGPTTYVLSIDGSDVMVPREWCERVELEIEGNRLYYYWDDDVPRKRAKAGKMIETSLWDHIEPVNRRWDELTKSKRSDFILYTLRLGIDGYELYKKVYKLITGENHP